MSSVRELVKRSAPKFVRDAVIKARAKMAAPPLESIVIHDYEIRPSDEVALRMTLVIPSLAANKVFGGVATGLEVFFDCAKLSGALMRILIDDFDRDVDHAFLEKTARRAGLDIKSVEILPRSKSTEPVDVRANDLFMAYNWWTALNVTKLITQQHLHFGGARNPMLYIVQEYEPGFYMMSSTHMFARSAFDTQFPVWGVFNSHQLHAYFHTQGHHFEKELVFEPRLAPGLKPYLNNNRPPKEKRILVYGRPLVPRNCFPAIVEGLKLWIETYPRASEWAIESAGVSHDPVALGRGRQITSLGKLSIDDYAAQLKKTAVGISLMSSAHPSYPPLEMAHFGVKTTTNSYLCKDLSTSHDNITSIADITPASIANALSEACREFDADPDAGWNGKSHIPEYLNTEPHAFLAPLAKDIRAVATAA